MARRITPRTERILWWSVAILYVLAVAASCWSSTSQTLNGPIFTQLAYGGNAKFERVAGGTAHATITGVTTVGVQLTHVTSQLQWLLVLSNANKSLLLALVGLTFGVVWIRTRGGRPFARSVTLSLSGLAIAVAVLGTFQEFIDAWVRMREAFEAVGSSFLSDTAYYNSDGYEISGLSIFIGLGIGVLASAFAIGARLSKETEGLV